MPGRLRASTIMSGRSARAIDSAAAQEHAQRQYIADVAGSGSSADELEKLSQLHDRGVLTDGEFAAQKQKILAS